MKTINLSSIHKNPWLRQFPNNVPEWGDWRFVFNADDEDYDYLVVFDDLHAPIAPKCPPENVIHLATEPPSVLQYNPNYLDQFAWMITQDKSLTRDGAIQYQPGLTWFIGWDPRAQDSRKTMSFNEIAKLIDQPKTKLISVVASNKAFTPEHKARLDFALKLKEHYGEALDFYGRGFVPMDDKLDSLRDYRFQVVLENSAHENYFSEKLTDCILAGTYPIYYGCPNLADYFPKNSYLPIDISDFDKSVAAIDQAILESYDQKYRAELLEARNLVLYEHNLYPMLINLIGKMEAGEFGAPNKAIRHGDEMLPFGSDAFVRQFATPKERLRLKLRNLADNSAVFDGMRRVYRKLRY